MGAARDEGSQRSVRVGTVDLPQSAGHPFCERPNRIFEAAGFGAFVEGPWVRFHAATGRPGPAPGGCFRFDPGYFEGLDPERSIAWQAT